jgi:hypothetical protein
MTVSDRTNAGQIWLVAASFCPPVSHGNEGLVPIFGKAYY